MVGRGTNEKSKMIFFQKLGIIGGIIVEYSMV